MCRKILGLCPHFLSWKYFHKAKVEKVVNPPQKPVARRIV